MENFNEDVQTADQIGKLGKLPAKSSMKALHFADFENASSDFSRIPALSKFWTKRAPFPLRSFGNNQYGDCTRAKQAIAAMRMERLETNNTPDIADEEVVRVYLDMTSRLYGGGDTGAYEMDALNEWRRPDLTFRDTKGRPLTIDAYLKINHTNINEIKRALYLSAAHGIAICMNLPAAFARMTTKWEIPVGQPLVGEWLPSSWGGHSMNITEFNQFGVLHTTTWGIPDIWISWEAIAAYADEAYTYIDSLDTWSKAKPKALNYEAIKDAVNEVSSQKIK